MRLRCVFVLAAFFAGAGALSAASTPEYLALRADSPDGAALAVRGLDITRGELTVHLERGAWTFLKPVAGRAVGAVFSGQGSYTLKPASATERAYLAFRTGEANLVSLTDSFSEAVFLFTDGTESDVRKVGQPGAADQQASSVLDRFRHDERLEFRRNFDLRVLADLLGEAPGERGAFLGFIPGKRFAHTLLANDPRSVERLPLAPDLGRSTLLVASAKAGEPDYLYVSPPRPRSASELALPFRADDYTAVTRISKDARVSGTTTIRFETREAARVVPFYLAPKLRISEASLAADGATPEFHSVDFIQEKEDEDADAAAVLPRALEPGRKYLLRVAYAGRDVLRDAGDGNYSVGARESWYPNLGVFREPAAFDLTFRSPKERQVISVGEPKEDRVEGDERVSHFVAGTPIRVAGFNYGKFRKVENKDDATKIDVQVFTNPGTPDVITEINRALQNTSQNRTTEGLSAIPTDLDNPMASVPSYVGRQSLTVDTEGLAQAALADATNTARVDTAYFGPLPYNRVAVTQQSQWSFGQSWPQLIYMPYLAFLDGGVRHELGLSSRGVGDFINAVGPHEFSHQWWGHLVGWDSYRDQWLSEGFAEFSTSLVLQRTLGAARFQSFWENARREITARPTGGAVANDAAGPIVLGWRLATEKNPGAYAAMVYEKGAYVLQMLRMLMWDPGKKNGGDEDFIAMMKDYVRTWAGKNPTTEEFQAVIEKHMSPRLDATHNGKMDWFFDEWVRGSEIPRYKVNVDVEKVSSNKYRLKGSVEQSGVSPNFRMLVPLYLEFSKGVIRRFGATPMVGSTSVPINAEIDLPEKPKRVLVNAMHDVLSRD